MPLLLAIQPIIHFDDFQGANWDARNNTMATPLISPASSIVVRSSSEEEELDLESGLKLELDH